MVERIKELAKYLLEGELESIGNNDESYFEIMGWLNLYTYENLCVLVELLDCEAQIMMDNLSILTDAITKDINDKVWGSSEYDYMMPQYYSIEIDKLFRLQLDELAKEHNIPQIEIMDWSKYLTMFTEKDKNASKTFVNCLNSCRELKFWGTLDFQNQLELVTNTYCIAIQTVNQVVGETYNHDFNKEFQKSIYRGYNSKKMLTSK